MAYILGVDIGTSGTKTVLFSEDGTPVASALYDYPLTLPATAMPSRILRTGGTPALTVSVT